MSRSYAFPAFILLASLALLGAAPPQGLPRCVHSPFAGITQTLDDGTIVGEPDAGDWGCAGGASPHDAIRVTPGRGAARYSASDVPVPPPTVLCLEPAAPNPAETATRLQFALPVGAHVTLIVYGRQQGHGPRETFVARTLMDSELAPGFFTVVWDLKDESGLRVEPGVYRAVLAAGDDALCGDVEVR